MQINILHGFIIIILLDVIVILVAEGFVIELLRKNYSKIYEEIG